MGLVVFEIVLIKSKINKHFILPPDNDVWTNILRHLEKCRFMY